MSNNGIYPDFTSISFTAKGFACNDEIIATVTNPFGPGGTSSWTGKSDSQGNVDASNALNTGASVPGPYLLVVLGSRGGKAAVTLIVTVL